MTINDLIKYLLQFNHESKLFIRINNESVNFSIGKRYKVDGLNTEEIVVFYPERSKEKEEI